MSPGLSMCAGCLRKTARRATSDNAVRGIGLLLLRQSLNSATRQYATTARAPSTTEPQRGQLAHIRPGTTTERAALGKLERNVRYTLKNMDDPYQVAQHVRQILGKGSYDEALLLTQTASRSMNAVVSWNHLIDYNLENQQLKQAIKLFNDMKKRAQKPNAQTFTIIFRGCARSKFYTQAVQAAVKHYNMLLQDSRLDANITHLNAVLNACAKAGDLDSMFLIADTINDTTRLPNAYTYTTILNGLRAQGGRDRIVKHLSLDERKASMDKLVERAKGLWTEVIDHWKNGKLIIDEQLVCAMGRVMYLTFETSVKLEIFDLLEQTMKIPNLVKKLKEQRDDRFPNVREVDESVLNKEAEGLLQGTGKSIEDPSMRGIAVSGGSVPVPASSAYFAVPGCNTLSLVVQTAGVTRRTTAGITYWNLLVKHYGIVPDRDAWLRLFGMLKIGKASAHAASVLEMMPDDLMAEQAFRITMEACLRDNINPNAIENSNKVLDVMLKRLQVPDLHALRLYLRLSLVSNFQLRSEAAAGQEQEARLKYGMQISHAVMRLWEPYQKVHSHYFHKVKARDDLARGRLHNDQREVIALGRLMYGAFSKIIEEKMIPDSALQPLRPLAAELNRGVTEFFATRDDREPNLPTAKLRRAARVGNGAGLGAARDEDGAVPEGGELAEEEDAAAKPDLWDGIQDPVGAYVWKTPKAEKAKGRGPPKEKA